MIGSIESIGSSFSEFSSFIRFANELSDMGAGIGFGSGRNLGLVLYTLPHFLDYSCLLKPMWSEPVSQGAISNHKLLNYGVSRPVSYKEISTCCKDG